MIGIGVAVYFVGLFVTARLWYRLYPWPRVKTWVVKDGREVLAPGDKYAWSVDERTALSYLAGIAWPFFVLAVALQSIVVSRNTSPLEREQADARKIEEQAQRIEELEREVMQPEPASDGAPEVRAFDGLDEMVPIAVARSLFDERCATPGRGCWLRYMQRQRELDQP